MTNTYKLVVLTNAVPDQDSEFNAWYDNIHLKDILKLPGLVAATRFRMVTSMTGDSHYRYCAIYDLESDDPERAISEMQAIAGTADMPISAAMHAGFYAAVFEETISLTRASTGVDIDRACKHL